MKDSCCPMPPRLRYALGATEVQSSSFICMQTRFQVPPGTFAFRTLRPISRGNKRAGETVARPADTVSRATSGRGRKLEIG